MVPSRSVEFIVNIQNIAIIANLKIKKKKMIKASIRFNSEQNNYLKNASNAYIDISMEPVADIEVISIMSKTWKRNSVFVIIVTVFV